MVLLGGKVPTLALNVIANVPYCNTIIHLLFHYFLLHRSLLHFLTASYNVTCDCSIRISYMTVVLE